MAIALLAAALIACPTSHGVAHADPKGVEDVPRLGNAARAGSALRTALLINRQRIPTVAAAAPRPQRHHPRRLHPRHRRLLPHPPSPPLPPSPPPPSPSPPPCQTSWQDPTAMTRTPKGSLRASGARKYHILWRVQVHVHVHVRAYSCAACVHMHECRATGTSS